MRFSFYSQPFLVVLPSALNSLNRDVTKNNPTPGFSRAKRLGKQTGVNSYILGYILG